MFNGAQDHFHQFIAPRTPLPLHLSFPLHASTNPNSFLPFDPYNPSHQLPLQATLLHHLHQNSPTHNDEEKEADNTVSSISFEIERDQRQLPELIDSWTNDEVLALLRIRSSMDSCFPELTWEHVSRKLAELGFKKSADKCKEKFEDESRCFNNINYGKNYRFLSELEEFYQGDQNHDGVMITKINKQLEKPSQGGGDKMGHALEEDSTNIDPPRTKSCERSDKMVEKSKERKRKRRDRFEIFKGFCESVVSKMMAHQEEIHDKILEEMVKRDEEKLAREEAWKKQEMDRMNKELEIVAQEQAIAGYKQTTMIEFLKKYVTSFPQSQNFGGENGECKGTDSNRNNPRTSSSSLLHSQNPTNPSTGENNLEPTPSNMILNHQTNGTSHAQNPSSGDTMQVPSSSNSSTAPHNPSFSLNSQNNHPLESNSVSTYKASMSTNEKEDVGRRWPRDEVLALINLRSSSVNNNSNDEKEGNKAPLWERISQGMLELGYKRSAKRCKEKWENINKYFRKTKDVNKKRSPDSRTCPYFHQLKSLYSQGKLVLQSERLENHLNLPANSGQRPLDQGQPKSSQVGSAGLMGINVDNGG